MKTTRTKINIVKYDSWDSSKTNIFNGYGEILHEFNVGNNLCIRKLPDNFADMDFIELANTINFADLPIILKTDEKIKEVMHLSNNTMIITCHANHRDVIYIISEEIDCELFEIGV